MASELHLVVLWEKARVCEARILEDLAREVEIVATLELAWPGDPTDDYGRFYGAKLQEAAGKTAICGGGPFLLVVVRDRDPHYGWRETSRGSELVNLRLFGLKARYRDWTGGGHRVHTTNSPEETRRDIYLLTGHTADEWEKGAPEGSITVLPGQNGWRSLRELFVCLGETTRYVVLRNSEMLPDGFDPSLHGDIDLLVPDAGECAGILGARKVFPEPHRVHYEVRVAGVPVRLDLRFVGDGYFDARWERAILAGGVVADGVRRPAGEDAFYALVYHALFQKRAIAPDYGAKALALAKATGIGGETFDEWAVGLDEFLRTHGYRTTEPRDRSVYLDDLLPRWREIASAIGGVAPLGNLRPFGLAARRVSDYLPTLLLSAEFEGRDCIVKYSPVAPRAIAAEWAFPLRVRNHAPQLCVEPFLWHALPDGGAFVVLEKLEGETLEARLSGGCLIGESEASSYVEDMVAIVRALEAAGVVHRDIRPANLFVTRGGHVKIIDFQFAINRSGGGEYAYFAARAGELLYPLGAEYALAPGVWNDRHAMIECLRRLPACTARDKAIRELAAGISHATVKAQLPHAQKRKLKREFRRLLLRRLRHKLLFRKDKPHDVERFRRLRHMLSVWN